MNTLTQDQLLQALSVHFHNMNQILDQLQIHAATATTTTAMSTANKYIALPKGFDGNPKHWHMCSRDNVTRTYRPMLPDKK